MNIFPTAIPDVKVIEPTIFSDTRGYFYESFNLNKFQDHVQSDINFVQDNHSLSSYGTLRGMHYQVDPFAQGKLVRVVQGEVFDVAVDIRPDAPTFGKWVGELISSGNKKQLWIPPGFAHGFLVLSESAEFLYKTTNFYSPSHEQCIRWDDPDLDIKWPTVEKLIISNKDQNGKLFKTIKK